MEWGTAEGRGGERRGGVEGEGTGQEVDRISWNTCFSPEAEGAEGALSMPDVKMGNQLATALVHILPTWGGGRAEGLRNWAHLQVFEETYSVAGVMQGAVGRDEAGVKAGGCLEWMGVLGAWTGTL